MERIEAFLRKYFPDEFGDYFNGESIEDKAIRLLCYTHERRKGAAGGAVLYGVMACQIFFARRTLERLQSGALSVEEAAHEIAETLDSMTKDALVGYIRGQLEEEAAPGEPCNDPEFDPYHRKKEKEE